MVDRYIVVENAGYEGERDVHTSTTYPHAMKWMKQHYEQDEVEDLNVAICLLTNNGRTYDI